MSKKAELYETIKNSDDPKAVVDFITVDKSLIKSRSGMYSALNIDSNIVGIENTVYLENKPKKKKSVKVARKDFDEYVINNKETRTSKEILNTSVHIIAPVLTAGNKTKWKGEYEFEKISFSVTDQTFLQQVYDNEISFVSATIINCDLTITTIIKYDKDGNIASEKIDYVVDFVRTLENDEKYVVEAKAYKKKKKLEKEDKKQLSLFD